jgi:MHS family proline/betaine transporter-like MFS transporter
MGRRTSMLITFWLIGFATLLTGLIPNYSSIGDLAPALLLVFRLLAGFGSSGEWGSEGSYLIELGGSKRRAYYSSFQQFTVVLGLLLGTVTGIVVTSFGSTFFYSEGWRLPFIVGGVILLPTAFILRLRLPESKKFEQVVEKKETLRLPFVKVFTTDWKPALYTAVAGIVWEASFALMLSYLPTYLATNTTLSLHSSLVITSIGTAVLCAFIPMWGYLSDTKLGRRKTALIGGIGYIVLPYPMFSIIRGGDFVTTLLAVVLLDFFISPLSGVLVAWIGENFPTNNRASAYIPYFISETIFFGFTGAIITYLLQTTHNPESPVILAAAAGVASTIVYLLMKETANIEELPDTVSLYASHKDKSKASNDSDPNVRSSPRGVGSDNEFL